MRYRLSNIKISPETYISWRQEYEKVSSSGSTSDGKSRDFTDYVIEGLTAAVSEICLGKKGDPSMIGELFPVKESLDARKDIQFVYTVDFNCGKELDIGRIKNLTVSEKESYSPSGLCYKGSKRPVIIGFGPCGIFAGLVLSLAGAKPIILERGGAMEERVAAVSRFWETGKLDENTNVQFGEGGAGTFSDGKLTTGIRNTRIGFVLEEFVNAGADRDILYKQKPHIGTDVLKTVVVGLRKKIEALGGEVWFNRKASGFIFREDSGSRRICGVILEDGSEIETGSVVLAAGHSARDTFKVLYENDIPMEQKPFSMGVRIEHPQAFINRVQHGKYAGLLGAADYKLSCRTESGRGCYTFCMCPGGEVVMAASEKGGTVTNGMSYRSRDGEYANSALLVDVKTSDFSSDHPLAGIEFQRKYERLAFENSGESYKPVTCTVGELLSDSSEAGPLVGALPGFAVDTIKEALPVFGRKLRLRDGREMDCSSFDSPSAKLYATETRSSSPVRIVRNDDLQSMGAGGLYPAGEGAGYAGGIMSAAVDGIRVAEKIIENSILAD